MNQHAAISVGGGRDNRRSGFHTDFGGEPG